MYRPPAGEGPLGLGPTKGLPVSVTTVPILCQNEVRGGEYGREKARVGAPMAPPIGSVPVSFTGKFADILGYDCM